MQNIVPSNPQRDWQRCVASCAASAQQQFNRPANPPPPQYYPPPQQQQQQQQPQYYYRPSYPAPPQQPQQGVEGFAGLGEVPTPAWLSLAAVAAVCIWMLMRKHRGRH